jgi:integrase
MTPTLRLAGDSQRAMPRKLKFTAAALAGVKAPPEGRATVYDTLTPSLALTVTSNGARAFYVIRRIAGRAQRVRLGGPELTIEQARTLATKLNGEVAGGADPAAARRAVRKAETLQTLFDRWWKKHAIPRLAAKTRITDKSRFDTCLADLAGRKLTSITEADARELHAKIGQERGHVSANRAVQLLRRLFNFARIGHQPVSRGAVELFQENSRERFVQPDELPRLFGAMNAEGINPDFRDAFMLGLLTGARRSNVLAMRDEQINLAAATWTIPGTASKNHKPITVALVPDAVKIIRRRMGHASGYIFPGTGRTGHLADPKATWAKIRESAGLHDLTIHDLRRTLGSYMAAGGASLPIIGASLGHRDPSATKIYSRLHLDPVRLSVTAATDAILKAGGARAGRRRRKQ